MRTIPEALAGHLAGDATTLCHCWRVTRRDGVVLGFTDHDRDLAFGGTNYLAASGFEASETEEGKGLSAEAGEVAGGFSADTISEADLSAGRYDGAKVEVFAVNWQTPSQRVALRTGEIGEVTRAGDAFRAELRRLTHRLDQAKGRVYGHRCDAMLGDARCGVNAGSSAYRANGVVTAVLDERRIRVSGLVSFADRFFRHGVLTFSGGVNAGLTADIEDHRRFGETGELTLWLPVADIAAGDGVSVTAGCDKSFGTCRTKFGNGLNFRGFPHMPGSDFAYGYADGETVHDGRTLHE